MTALEIKVDWTITKSGLKETWTKLTDDDFEYIEGIHEELSGRIQKCGGESREAVEEAVREAAASCCSHAFVTKHQKAKL